MSDTLADAAPLPAAGSAAAFVVEHYWGYTRQRDGGTVEYQVTHPPWRTWRAVEAGLRVDAAGLYGPAFREVLAGPPASVVAAEGSSVTVYFPRRLPRDRRGPDAGT